jgi:hypothetical protein
MPDAIPELVMPEHIRPQELREQMIVDAINETIRTVNEALNLQAAPVRATPTTAPKKPVGDPAPTVSRTSGAP